MSGDDDSDGMHREQPREETAKRRDPVDVLSLLPGTGGHRGGRQETNMSDGLQLRLDTASAQR